MPTPPARPSVLFVNQHYHPDVAATGQILTDLAEHLAAEGLDVHVLTASAKYVAGELGAPEREVHNGVTVHRVRTTAFGRGTALGRIVDYASFYVRVLSALLFGRRHDLVVCLTTPPLLSVAGALGRVLRGRRYAVWSMDLHPDAEEAVGMIRPGGLASRVLHALNDFGYGRADLVVALGRHMGDRIAGRGVDRERIRVLPVWSHADDVTPLDPEDNPLVGELGLEGKFVVMYSGNAGVLHRFDEVLEVMRRLRDHPDVFFLFVGGGPRRPEIEAFIARERLGNARYLDYFPRDQIRQSLGLGSVHLLTLRNEAAGIAVPSKLYGVMAAGRPVIVVGPRHSEPADVVLSENVGRLVDTETGEDTVAGRLEAAVLDLLASPDECRALGARARAAFLRSYEARVVCAQWAETIGGRAGVVARRGSAEAAP